MKIIFDGIVKSRHSRENGNPENFNCSKILDSCFRRNDKKPHSRTFCETNKINIILTLFFMWTFTTGVIVLMEPELSFGQPKKRTVVFQETRKDPFSLPSGVRLLSKEAPVHEDKKVTATVTPDIKPVETPFKLKAILITDHVRLASIDRSIVTVGDFVNGDKVLEIRSDRVILEKESKKRTLVLDQSPVKITVEGR